MKSHEFTRPYQQDPIRRGDRVRDTKTDKEYKVHGVEGSEIVINSDGDTLPTHRLKKIKQRKDSVTEAPQQPTRRQFLGKLAGGAAAAAGIGGTSAAQAEPLFTYAKPGEKTWKMATGFGNSTADMPVKDRVQGYRANEKTRQGLETIPTSFHGPWIISAMKAFKTAMSLNFVQPVSAEEFLALLLAEGRSDFGFNATDLRGKYGKMHSILMKQGVDETWASFAACIAEKQDVAARLGIPFYQAWQGSTKHLPRFELNLQAASDPKNAGLLAMIKKTLGLESEL